MKKLLRSLLADQIDAYYLLFVKFELGATVRPRVLLVDLLDHLNWTTYDDGPGQMMLLEQKFFEAMDRGYRASVTPIVTKIDRLFAMLIGGNARLILNRKRTIAQFQTAIEAYKGQSVHVIDQTGLGLIDEPDKD